MPAVEKNPEISAITPECRPAELPPTSGQDLPKLVRFAIETPKFFTRFRIEGRYAVVGCRHIQNAIDHEWRAFEKARHCPILIEWRFPMLPFPSYLQTLHIVATDVGQRRVPGTTWIAAIIEPFHLSRWLLSGDDRQ